MGGKEKTTEEAALLFLEYLRECIKESKQVHSSILRVKIELELELVCVCRVWKRLSRKGKL